MNRIIGCKFLRNGEPQGVEYSYFDGIGDISVGDLVIATVRNDEKAVLVTAVDIPESKVDERWLPTLKTITKRYEPPVADEAPAEETITMEELDNG